MLYLYTKRIAGWALFLVLITITLNSQARTLVPVERILTLHGSNTIGAELGPELAKAYLKKLGTKDVKISPTGKSYETRIHGILDDGGPIELEIFIAAHGSSTSFKSLLNGQADIGMASRSIKTNEAKALSAYGDMTHVDHEHIIAIDGLAIIVHPDNPISALDKKEIADIFSGRITNWSQLGGEEININLYARDNQSGTWDTFKNLILGKEQTLSTQATRFASNSVLASNVANDLGGIGFVGLSATSSAKVLAVSDHETLAIKPQRLSVATEDYPLARRLFLYTAKPTNPYVKDFINWALEQEGQDIAEKIGFVSQNIIALPKSTLAEGPDAYVNLSQKARRLSVNYHFSEGSAELDNKAIRDIDRLLDYIQSHPRKPKLWLVGFSDTKGRKSHSDVLSRYRALAVQRKLFSNINNEYELVGLGSFMPVVSNTNEAQKIKNGRVEIWVESQH